jgi:hypothetical protein
MRILVIVMVMVLFGGLAHAQGLNREFGLNLWGDSTLWDDPIDTVIQRIGIPESNSRQGVSQVLFDKEAQVLGTRPYTLQIFDNGRNPTHIIIAFANKPDMAFFMKQESGTADLSGSQQVELEETFSKQVVIDREAIEKALFAKLGTPRQSGQWLWTGTRFLLQETGDSLILRIEPERKAEMTSQAARTRTTDQIQKNANGDVILSGIPSISQGARNYCVPASWEKYLRFYGIDDVNVYDLATSGGSTLDGSQFLPFAAKVAPMLKKRGIEVDFVEGTPGDFAIVRKHIDRGIPLIWALDAQQLGQWAERSQKRSNRLPSMEASFDGDAMPHALLVVGYNAAFQEIALSDSTELGANAKTIWIRASEAKQAVIPGEKEMIVLTKSKSGSGGNRSTKAIPYKDKRYY